MQKMDETTIIKEAHKYLDKYYGYDEFRKGQEPLIEHIVKGQDVLGIMPTGGGKSICYQIPALMLSGVTLVISPLIALMKDQVDSLKLNGIEATFINSSLSSRAFVERCQGMREARYKLVYVAPERLLADDFLRLANDINISMVAVDEAHCISQWGHDFRPSYANIPQFIKRLDQRPIVSAFTATATARVIDEIDHLLELNDPYMVTTGFDRPNLYYSVLKPTNRLDHIKKWIPNHYPEDSGIIYCSTRKSVESLSEKLKRAGLNVAAYHGGMTSEARTEIQDDFMRDEINTIVATNAFGMGIDKPDIRYVIHYNMPANMESYYQEAGRAGRDGEASQCLLMYSPSDIVKQKMLIQTNDPSPERLKIASENLQILVDYCHTDDCLRRFIMSYFGETASFDACGDCGNCQSNQETIDMTLEAQKIMSCVYRMNERFGLNLVIGVLRGSKVKRIMSLGFDKLSTYGILSEMSEGALREMIMNLIARDYLLMTTSEYPVLKLTDRSWQVLKHGEKVMMKRDRLEKAKNQKTKSQAKAVSKEVAAFTDAEKDLYDKLAEKRAELAKTANLPRYMILANKAIEGLASEKPQTLEAMLEIKGIGEKKLEAYGQAFLDVILKA